MDIFWRLAFGHLLADFTFQTNYIAAWKKRSRWGLLTHVTLHPLFYIPLTWPYLNDVWVKTSWISLNGWTCVFLAYATHWLEDWWRVRCINRGAPDNFLFYAWDQVIHLVILFALSPMSNGFIGSKWPVLGCLFVLATHFATVTIYYIEKGMYSSEYPPTEEKYLTMLYRLAAVLCFLLPGYWWMALVVLMAGRFCWFIYKRRLDFSWTSAVLGNLLVVFCGATARFVLYHI